MGRRLLPKLLWWVARTGSRELFTLCVVAAALGIAYGAATLFDASFALGALRFHRLSCHPRYVGPSASGNNGWTAQRFSANPSICPRTIDQRTGAPNGM